MAHKTLAQWRAEVEACGGRIEDSDIINLVYADSPNAMFDNAVKIKQLSDVHSAYRYFSQFLPVKQFADWNGITEIGEEYHRPYVPIDFSMFQQTMLDCSPDTMDECDTNYCEIPEGGITKLPEHKMYKWGYKTKRSCIANYRTSGKILKLAQEIINTRFAVEEAAINSFYLYAVLSLLGHKFTLELDDNGRPVENSNPYNFVAAYRYAYMQQKFPAASDLNNISPLALQTLDDLGYGFAQAGRVKDAIGYGSRGEPLYELWVPNDWYRNEILNNPEHQERTKYFVKPQDLYGYRPIGKTAPPERETIGNFIIKEMNMMPRFAESTKGGITMIQQFNEIDADIGTRPIMNYREFRNAPFGVAMILGKDMGNILTRPNLNTGVEGLPISPITGGLTDNQWKYRNEYDKECNFDQNKPYWTKRFELGFKLNNADASAGFIFRMQRPRIRPINTCDLQPIFKVTPVETSCDVLTIGCNPPPMANNNIMEPQTDVRRVKCSAAVCGDSAGLIYRLRIVREDIDSITKNGEPLQGCGCGDEIQVLINNEDGETVKERKATILEYVRPNVVNVEPVYFVRLASALSAGECIAFITCKDASPTSATVVACNDNSDDEDIPVGTVVFYLDSPLPCGVGADVNIVYKNAAGSNIGAVVEGTIVEIEAETLRYTIESDDETGLPGGTAAFNCNMRTGQDSVVITCD